MSNPPKQIDSYTALQKKMNEGQRSRNPASRSSASSSSRREERSRERTPESGKKTGRGREGSRDRMPEQEKKKADAKAVQEDYDPDEPDRSFGDFYCRICDSHMNSQEMWIAHVTGKRHIKNVKKGDTDSKYEDIDDVSKVENEIKNVKEPVIGLDYIQEIRRREPGIPPIYSCFLCHASISTVPLVIDHVIGLKHRTNFLRENNLDEFKLLEQTNLKKGLLEPIVAEKAAKYEEKHGRGQVKVKQEKPKAAYIPVKTYYDDDDDDGRPVAKKSKNNEGTATVWKSVNTSNRHYRSEFDRRKDKRSFYHHDDRSRDYDDRSRDYDDRSNEYRKRPSEREDYYRSHSRLSEEEDYRRLKDGYSHSRVEEYIRSASPKRHYEQSPIRDLSPSLRRPSPTEYSDARQFLEARAQDRMQSSTVRESIPAVAQAPEKQDAENDPSIDNVKSFIGHLYNLPPKLFLKIFVTRLKNWTAFDLDKEALEYLFTINDLGTQIIKLNLPTEIQEMINDGVSLKAENINRIFHPAAPPVYAPTVQSASSAQKTPASNNFTIEDINELIFGAKKNASLPAPTQQTPGSTSATASYSVSQPSTDFKSLPNNFPSPASNFSAGVNNYPPPVNSYTSSANNYTEPANNYTSSANNYTEPANNYTAQQPIPRPVNNFPPPASSLPHPGNFASVNTLSTSSQPRYATYIPASNSGTPIPGLTLTEKEVVQNLPQKEPSSPYHWPGSNNNRGGTFKRY